MPEDRPAADLDQRLRHRLGPLAQTRPATAAKNDYRWFSHHILRGAVTKQFKDAGSVACSARERLRTPKCAASQRLSAAGHCRQDRYFVAVVDVRLQPLLEADVLSGDV